VGFVSDITCSGSIGASDPVAIVDVRASSTGAVPWVLRDYADIGNPRTVCHLPDGVLQLLDARHVLIERCDDFGCERALVDLPQVVYHWYSDPESAAIVQAQMLTVAPDVSAYAWAKTETDGRRSLHVTDAAGDHRIMSLREAEGRCGGYEGFSHDAAYTHSGQYLYVLDQPDNPDYILAVLRGTTRLYSLIPPTAGWATGAEPSIALWSPTSASLYFRRSGSIWQWSPGGGAKTFLKGVAWQFPSISPDGRHLAYAVTRSDGKHDVYLMDLAAGGGPVRIAQARTIPVFLNDSQLWYLSESDDGCAAGGGTEPRPLVYNIVSRTEAGSLVQAVEDVWPATSAIH